MGLDVDNVPITIMSFLMTSSILDEGLGPVFRVICLSRQCSVDDGIMIVTDCIETSLVKFPF